MRNFWGAKIGDNVDHHHVYHQENIHFDYNVDNDELKNFQGVRIGDNDKYHHHCYHHYEKE